LTLSTCSAFSFSCVLLLPFLSSYFFFSLHRIFVSQHLRSAPFFHTTYTPTLYLHIYSLTGIMGTAAAAPAPAAAKPAPAPAPPAPSAGASTGMSPQACTSFCPLYSYRLSLSHRAPSLSLPWSWPSSVGTASLGGEMSFEERKAKFNKPRDRYRPALSRPLCRPIQAPMSPYPGPYLDISRLLCYLVHDVRLTPRQVRVATGSCSVIAP